MDAVWVYVIVFCYVFENQVVLYLPKRGEEPFL